MKKVIAFCLVILIAFGSIISVCAESKVNFSLSDAECSTNRLVNIDIIADSNQNLSAASFEFIFDKDMFEFRYAKTVSENASIKANESDNIVKVIYLCADGIDISGGKTIFTVTFKAIKSGTGYIDFNVSECVNQNVEFIQVGTCTSAKITVGGSSEQNEYIDNDSPSENSDSNNLNSSKTSDSGKSSKTHSSRVETTTSQATIDNLGIINSINDNKNNYIFMGVLIGFCIVIVLAGVFIIGRKTAAKSK